MGKNSKYGSDLILDILKQHDIDYVAFNPGASFRGLHDSIVNYLNVDNVKMQPIMCCHEEISVAIAHGYAKASGKYMAVFVHANIGLQHASMAIFNAWCDRVPILIIGGVGPLDANKRRPWIDWIHTSNEQNNIVRDYVKWCDQPYSLNSTVESLYRACRILNTDPKAPVYIAIDSEIQEIKIDRKFQLKDVKQHLPPISPSLSSNVLEELSEILMNAEFPVIIADYMGRNPESVKNLQKLAELLSIPVIDYGGRYNFPNNHSLCLTGGEKYFFQKTDLILAIDVYDLHGRLSYFNGKNYQTYLSSKVKIIHITLSDYLISKWAADYHKLYPIDISLSADSNNVLRELYLTCQKKLILNSSRINQYEKRSYKVKKLHIFLRKKWKENAVSKRKEKPLALEAVLYEIWNVIKKEDWILTNNGGVEVGKWIKKLWIFNKLGCYLGESGGAGLGYGLGASIGAALANKESEKLCVNMQSDGDFLFTPSALWTAAHYQVPLLIIVLNNRSYNNSKEHAVKIASYRKRNVSNSNIGTCFEDPYINFPLLASSLGIFSIKTIYELNDIKLAVSKATNYVITKKKPALIDIVIK